MLEGINGSTLTKQVEKKLDSLFQEEPEKAQEVPDQDMDIPEGRQETEPLMEDSSQNRQEDSPLAPLKSIVLSLDWEITDATMAEFLAQTRKIQSEYESDQTLKTFAQMLLALGRYIKRHKGNSNPEAVRLLNTTFKSFEKVFEETGLPEAEKKALLDEKIKEFMNLKQAIRGRPTYQDQRKKGPSGDVDLIKEAVREAIGEAINDLKEIIREEFRLLRTGLKDKVGND